MDWLVNTTMLRNPANWFSIGAMLLIVFVGYLAIRSHLKASTMSAPSSDGPAVELVKES